MQDGSTALKLLLPSLVILVGPSGSGKSTFARQHFRTYEVVSSDVCRAMITDDPSNQDITPRAFELVRYIATLRLAAGRLAVIDATNVKASARQAMIAVAEATKTPYYSIVFDLPLYICLERNRDRLIGRVPEPVISEQKSDLEQSIPMLPFEGYAAHVIFRSQESIDRIQIVQA
jgi:predicted kinase